MRAILFSITITTLLIFSAATSAMQPKVAQAVAGGPVILMGIDAEDCGPGGHGPITVYDAVVTSLLAAATNGGTGILVIGGGAPCITAFWDQISLDTGVPVTYVTGASITTQSFAGFEMLAVVSDSSNTFGGLSDADNALLTARATDIASFVNGGGALLGFSNCTLSSPFGYIAGLGGFTCTPVFLSDITPTAGGLAVGITDALDVCCWHDEFTTFPSFLGVLAYYGTTTQVAAIGGKNVIISGEGCTPGYWTNNASTKKGSVAWTTPYTKASLFDTVFGVDISINWNQKGKPTTEVNPTLIQALQANGGGLNALARHGTAGLLDAANPNINYAFSTAQVIQKVQAAVTAFNGGDMATFNSLLEELSDANETFCPVNQQGIRVVP